MPILTKRFGASTFQEVFYTTVELQLNFSDWFLPLAFFSTHFYLIVLEDCGSEGGAAFGVGLARSLPLMRKLFEHCPFSFHAVTNTFSSFNTTAPVSIFQCLVSKIHSRSFLIYISPHHRFSIFDNRASIPSDEFPCHTIPIRL